jgi:hypothetical protein
MTVKIEVTVPHEIVVDGYAGRYLDSSLSALGYHRQPQTVWLNATGPAGLNLEGSLPVSSGTEEGATETTSAGSIAEAPKVARERGKPAPGRGRRTKEEIAEDEAWEKRQAQIAERAADDERHSRIMEAGRAAVEAEEKANISTGEERIDPTTAADAEQDAKDEADEAAAITTPALTHDDVRTALRKYQTTFGVPAAIEDGPKLLRKLFGAHVAKISDIPADQASLASAIAGAEEMLAKNPFGREAQL